MLMIFSSKPPGYTLKKCSRHKSEAPLGIYSDSKALFCKMKIFHFCVGRYNSAERQQIVKLPPSAGKVATSDTSYSATKTQTASSHRGVWHIGSVSVFVSFVRAASKQIKSTISGRFRYSFLEQFHCLCHYSALPQQHQQTNHHYILTLYSDSWSYFCNVNLTL